MFNFRQPMPILSGRPVAVQMVRQSARQQAKAGASTTLTTLTVTTPSFSKAPLTPGAVASAPASLALTLQPSLASFATLLAQYAGQTAGAEGAGRIGRHFVATLVVIAAALRFWFVRDAAKAITLTVDRDGIVLACGRGVRAYPWREVQALKRYRSGYLLVLRSASVPIPLAAFAAHQGRDVAALIAAAKGDKGLSRPGT